MKILALVIASTIFVSNVAEAGRPNPKKDPNLEYEGNKVMVKREACLAYGGKITDDDKRYFTCVDGKYDGYITSGPAEDYEGDKDEEL